ncbi:Hypothetical predicted protein [Xyrichtys novacula]|uniref:Uncharacterized protein n=1 Tax=Xyrichtys novacula TaxID=13765 RepID=A0AAV1F0D0_XYRNO|nr:Hypothetical predicted protein [Xyrichtys novacula]
MQHISHHHTTALLGRRVVHTDTTNSPQSLRSVVSARHESDFNEQSNQRDTRQTITKRRQCLSDGPNVTDLRAAVCEGQAWHAAEQRGPRADPQSRLGNWLDAPDTSPLCTAAALT